MMVSPTLIRGGCVLTLGTKTPNFTRADVLIEDGRIAEVGPGLRARGVEVVEADDTIVMPGFVDTHRHTWRSLFRNTGGSSEGGSASPAVYGPHYGPDDVYVATLVGLLGAIEAGITTVVDWSDVPPGEEFQRATLEAHADSGIRSVYVRAAPGWLAGAGDSVGPFPVVGGPGERSGSRATMAFGSSDPKPGDQAVIGAEWNLAREAGMRIHAHVATEPGEAGVVAALGSAGLLGNDVTLVHCSHADGADLSAIAAHGAGVSLTPSSEMAGGLGTPPIQALIDQGIRPGLGTDEQRIGPGDMFAPMREINSFQHAAMFDLKLAGKAGLPTLLTTREVIRYATHDGARAVGLEAIAGSIEPGKRADVIVLRADRPNIAPLNDPIGAVVWGMDTSNLDWVFVDGEAVMVEGVLQGRVGEARARANAAQRRVAEAAGLLAGTGGGAW